MFGMFALKPNTPPEIRQFEGWFAASLATGILVAILMYHEVIDEWGGPLEAAVVTIVLFGGAWGLMICTSRFRSNLARWLLVVGSTIAVLPYLAHVSYLIAEEKTLYLSFLQAGLQWIAIYYLFTSGARAWFSGRPASLGGPAPPEEEPE